MDLHTEWKSILRKAWSIRFILLAGVLSTIEGIFSLIGGIPGVPHGLFAVAAGIASGGAFVARMVAQKDLSQ